MLINGHYERSESEYKDGWEKTRLIIHTLAAVNGAKESATELMPFSWDKKKRLRKEKPMSNEEIQHLMNAYVMTQKKK